MSLLQYTITNNSTTDKIFTYFSASSYHDITVVGNDTVIFNAEDTPPPYQSTSGIDENDFLNSSIYTPPNGFAYLWNDGTKVKHIKISNLAANGQSLSSFVTQADWIRFLMTEAKNSDGNYVHPSSYLFPQPEQYVLRNATIENGYSHLFVNQDSPLTSTAVASENPNYLNFNFTGSGDIILYDTSSGDITDPVFDPSAEPQGYFPRNIESASIDIKEQFFREYDGPINDSLGFFNEDTGIYTFGISSTETIKVISNISLTGSTPDPIFAADYGTAEYGIDEYGGTGAAPTAITWETASLKLYVNNFHVETSTIYVDDISSPENINLTYSYTPSIGDTLKMSLDVTGSQANKTALNSALLVTDYTLSVSASVPPASDLVPTYFNNSISIIDDCDPFLNNIVGDRPNERLQDVDYSVDALDPINFEQIIENKAVRATVPESNYTQLGFSNQRYNGSTTTRDNINEYNSLGSTDPINKKLYSDGITDSHLVNKGKGPSIGKVPNVELNNAYIGYFNKIIDPYPTLNNKTAYYIKYLIDESGTIFEPSLSDINYDTFTKTFRLYDYDLKPTRSNISIQNIDETKELSKLEKGLSSTFRIGEYPVPILYTQTSSIGHTNNIILSGSPFYGTLGLEKNFTNFGSNIYSTQPSFPNASGDGLSNTDLSISPTLLDFNDTEITLFDPSVGVYPTSSNVDGAILFPLDPNNEFSPNTPGGGLSDDYRIDGTFEFYSSAIPPRYKRKSGDSSDDKVWRDYKDRKPDVGGLPGTLKPLKVNLYPFIKFNTDDPDASGDYLPSLNNFNIKSITLTIYFNAGEDNEQSTPPIELLSSPLGYNTQWYKNNSTKSLILEPEGLYIEKLVIEDLMNGGSVYNGASRLAAREYLFGTWFRENDGSVDGWGGKTVIYKWSVNFEQSNVKQLSGFYLKAQGDLNFNYDAGSRDDIFSLTGVSTVGETLQKHSRTFTPSTGNSFDTQPLIKYTITSPLAGSDANKNGAPAPYWRRIPSGSGFTSNSLYMSSSVLNQAYALLDKNENSTNGVYYIQGKLDYVPGPSTDFPLTQEPDFIEFDPVTDPWSLKIGDEIRFENNENYTYTIAEIKEPLNLNSDSISDKLQVVVTPPFTDEGGTTFAPTNFDFFVVRRYKENKNFIIMDQQKPYGFPVSASSSPGILLPEHRIERFNVNPDAVLKDLIEKNII